MPPTVPFLLATALSAHAGGDPRQVLVVANADNEDSLAIAEHYAVSRQLPDGHICAISDLEATTTTIPFSDYASAVVPTLDACLAALPDPDAIQLLVTTRGLPYVVSLEGGYVVGFEALLQVHHTTARADGAELSGQPQTNAGGYYAASIGNPVFAGSSAAASSCDFSIENTYSASYTAACSILTTGELPEAFDRHGIRTRGDWDFQHNLFLVTRLDGFDATDAMDLVDRGVTADGTFPAAPLMCMRSADSARGARDPECELVARALDGAGLNSLWLDTFDNTLSGQTVAGYLTGAASMTGAIADNVYVPGALTDNLTSYGAVPTNFFCDASGETCPASESQTSVARFVRAGATGAHGTVAEPLNNVFPNASLYLLYTFGYSLGESYLFSQKSLYWQNLVLGDPLTTPYATRPVVTASTDPVPVDRTWTATASHPDGVAEISVYAQDVEVAWASGDTIEVDAALLGVEGDRLQLYVVAVAEDAPQVRDGWDVSELLPTPSVRGWSWVDVEITAAEPTDDTGTPDDSGIPADTGTGGDPDDTDIPIHRDSADPDSEPGSPEKGGCSTAPGAPALGWMCVWAALLLRRSRR